ncbi:MAG: NAD-dependent epimerase/dehydratase family protein [Actinomycetota bacterium]
MGEIQHVLVTGGCGFIGANLIRFLAERTPYRLRVLDDLRTGKLAYVPEEMAEVRVGDVADADALEPGLHGVDAVVHLASQTGVAPSVEDPRRDFEGNTRATFAVLDACRRQGVSRVVYASSGAAVGEVTPPIHEEVVPRPVSPYGASKLAGEAYCRAFSASFGLQAVALRFSNTYGPFSAHKRNSVPNFIKRGITGEPIEIYGDGGQTRDFIYVEDLCDAIVRSLTATGVGGEVFQVATGVETSIKELAEITRSVVGGPEEIRFAAGRSGEVYRTSVDISKIRRVLGFEPRFDLREGLSRTVQWYRRHWSPDDA